MTEHRKYVELIHETQDAYICTVWTGPNYYIGWFDKKEIDGFMEYAAECGHCISFEKAISRTPVSDMQFMCKTEDYSKEIEQAWIKQWTKTGGTDHG